MSDHRYAQILFGIVAALSILLALKAFVGWPNPTATPHPGASSSCANPFRRGRKRLRVAFTYFADDPERRSVTKPMSRRAPPDCGAVAT